MTGSLAVGKAGYGNISMCLSVPVIGSMTYIEAMHMNKEQLF